MSFALEGDARAMGVEDGTLILRNCGVQDGEVLPGERQRLSATIEHTGNSPVEQRLEWTNADDEAVGATFTIEPGRLKYVGVADYQLLRDNWGVGTVTVHADFGGQEGLGPECGQLAIREEGDGGNGGGNGNGDGDGDLIAGLSQRDILIGVGAASLGVVGAAVANRQR